MNAPIDAVTYSSAIVSFSIIDSTATVPSEIFTIEGNFNGQTTSTQTTVSGNTSISFEMPNVAGEYTSSGTFAGNESYSASNSSITDNIIIDASKAIYCSFQFTEINGITISNNNVVSIDTSATALIDISHDSLLIKNAIITNNIFYGEYNILELDVTNIDGATSTIDHNNYQVEPTITFSNTITGALESSGTNNVIGDPLWIDVDEHDFYLKSISPCIETGTLDSDIGAIPYQVGVNVYIQDSVISNFSNSTSEDVNLRLENSALDNTLTSDFNLIKNTYNQFDFNPPVNYPLLKDKVGYDEDLTWLIDNRIELAPFPDIDSPPLPGKGYPEFADYQFGIYGFRRDNGQ
jgi:hypothetical protein